MRSSCAANPEEILMRILALAILAIGTVSIGPAAAQKYDPAYPVCLHRYGLGGSTITIAATRRCLSATRRHRAARHSATSIPISRARKSPGNDIIGGTLASTKSQRVRRTSGPENFQSSTKKDFFNTIGQQRKFLRGLPARCRRQSSDMFHMATSP